MSRRVSYSDHLINTLLSFQKNEMTSAAIYTHVAKRTKDPENRLILKQIANDERQHAQIWKQYTKRSVRPNLFKVFLYIILVRIFGYTFIIKLLETNEYKGIRNMNHLTKELPDIKKIIAHEEKHEKKLIAMLDEERLNYVGAMVLGLNDALVELTGTIAGITFVLMNTRLIALTGIITGIAATLSMAASNYLAERANGNPNAFKACLYTGLTYSATVVCLVLPYLLLPNKMIIPALGCMIGVAVTLIFIFNFYIATVKSERFWPKFTEMALISLSVTLISFLIGSGAKSVFGVSVD